MATAAAGAWAAVVVVAAAGCHSADASDADGSVADAALCREVVHDPGVILPDDPLRDVAVALGEGVVLIADHAKGTDRLDLRVVTWDGAPVAEASVTAEGPLAVCPAGSSCRGGLVAAAGEAGFAVLWPVLMYADDGAPQDPYANSVFAVVVDASGAAGLPSLVHEQYTGTKLVDARPRALVWAEDEWLAAWSEVRELPAMMGRDHRLAVATFDATGAALTRADVPHAAPVRPEVAVTRRGAVAVAAFLLRENDPVRDDVWIYRRDLASGDETLGELPEDAALKAWPAIAAAEDGSFVLAWTRETDAAVERVSLDASATPVGAPGLVPDAFGRARLVLRGGDVEVVSVAEGELLDARLAGDRIAMLVTSPVRVIERCF